MEGVAADVRRAQRLEPDAEGRLRHGGPQPLASLRPDSTPDSPRTLTAPAGGARWFWEFLHSGLPFTSVLRGPRGRRAEARISGPAPTIAPRRARLIHPSANPEEKIETLPRARPDGRSARPYTAATPTDEAHLPAEEAQASPDPRVPRPHAHARGPGDHQAPAPQGPQAPDHLTMAAGDAGARKRRRLSRSGDFDRVYRDGYLAGHPPPGALQLPPRRGGEDDPAWGLGRAARSAARCERNRVKRAMREAFWGLAERAAAAEHDFVLVARPEIGALVEQGGTRGAVRSCIEEALADEDAGEARST